MSEIPWSYSRVAAIRACDAARLSIVSPQSRTALHMIERAIADDDPIDAKIFANDLAHKPLADAVAIWYASFPDLGAAA